MGFRSGGASQVYGEKLDVEAKVQWVKWAKGLQVDHPKNSHVPPKRDHFKRTFRSSNHHFSGDMLIFRGVVAQLPQN